MSATPSEPRDPGGAAPRRRRRPRAETRAHVLAVAGGLFYSEGIHRTGVDRVAVESGVGPTTLYRLFASKDDLVAAYVEHSAAGYRELIEQVTATGTPRERILAIFDATIDAVQAESCRGCPFLMTLAEFPDASAGAHAAAVEVKAWVRVRLGELVAELGAPDALADQLALVLEGIYGTVQALTAAGPARQARAAAETLIAASSPPR